MRLLAHLGSQFVTSTPLWRREKGMHATLAVKLHVALDRHKGNSKGACDLCMSRVAIDHKLACEHPKGRQVSLLVHKNR